MEPPPRPIAGPAVAALGEFSRCRAEARRMQHHLQTLCPLALSYEAHRRQLHLLLLAHAPLVLVILVLAAVGGHMHTMRTVLLVGAPLLVGLAVSTAVFGVRADRVWIQRAFALALFAISLWSMFGVLYAVLLHARMRSGTDRALLALQAVDVAIAVGYFYTAEMLAGIGGEASAEAAELHFQGLVLHPLAATLGDAAAANHAATQPGAAAQLLAAIGAALGAGSRARRKTA